MYVLESIAIPMDDCKGTSHHHHFSKCIPLPPLPLHLQVLATNDVPPVSTANFRVDKITSILPQFRCCRSLENPNILVPVW